MLIITYGPPDSGKTTFSRHLARTKGKTLMLLNEGNITPQEGETIVRIPAGVVPAEWLRAKFGGPESQAKLAEFQSVILDSITGIHDAYAADALSTCLQDDKLKNKHPSEKAKMTLATVPFGMGEAVRGEKVKQFVDAFMEVFAGKFKIVVAHTQLLTVVNADQTTVDVVSLGLGGKAEKSAAGRNALAQHADAIVFCDATSIKIGDVLEPARRIIVGQHGRVMTKYKGPSFGKDEFFECDQAYNIKGREALTATIKSLF